MQGQLEFFRVTEGPDFATGLYAGASPATSHMVCELWGGHKIDRKWPAQRENAMTTLRRIDDVGNGPKRTVVYSYQEGANIEMGLGMVLLTHDYVDAPVLLSVVQCQRLIAAWTALLLTRPHKTELLPEPIAFDYLAEAQAAETMFASAFQRSS